MNILINVILDFMQITKFFILGDYFFVLEKRNKWYEKWIIYAIMAVSSVVFYVYHCNLTITIGLYVLLVFVLFIFRYKEKLIKLLLISLWSNFILAMIDEISKVIVITSMAVVPTLMMPSEYILRFFKQVLTLMFLIIIGILLKRKHKTGIKGIGCVYYIGFTILFFVDSAILTYLSDFTIDKVIVERKTLFQIVFLIVSIGMLFQMAMVIFLAVSRNVYRENQSLASKYLNDQKKHYEYLETRERETKKFRHDLRHHMYMLNTLNHQEEYEKLDEYIKKMYGEIEAFGSNICVNNGIVDAILNKFADEAEQEGIKLKVEGHFPLKCNIDAYDLCTIFSNLLNNALEAEEKSGGNTIRLSCRFTEDHIIVCIENDTARLENGKDGKFETTKEDKWNHGFGLENVKRSVEKNKGEILIESQDNTFRVTIVLNNDGEM